MTDTTLPEQITAYLACSPLVQAGARAIPLTGDASDRRYFRVLDPGGRSVVLALYGAPFDFDRLPFVNVARLFERAALPVPAILGHSGELGVLALEDLGDVTLQAHLGIAPPEHRRLYREAIGCIDRMQRRGRELASDEFVPYTIAFDVEKLTWELRFFVKHFVEGYRGAALAGKEREALDLEWRAIAEELAAEPRVLCHRDYHSRNLMVHEGRLYMIDFQDARMGPDTYDLVSLLRDSYVDFTEDAVSDLVAYFLALKGEGARYEADFQRRFDLMALQRNLKALGTFGYQTTVRRNPVYIQYMARTLRYVAHNLDRHPRFARLQELLSAHIGEIGEIRR